MTKEEKMKACKDFFDKLSEALDSEYEVLGSCNKDNSAYLIPIGTSQQVTYYGKPNKSFRISDHWNWYSSLKKNPNEKYIQCLSSDMPRAKNRPLPWKASRPIVGYQVAIVGSDGKYHHDVLGEKYNRKSKVWEWKENTLSEVIKMVL